jgi:hypothetical protein
MRDFSHDSGAPPLQGSLSWAVHERVVSNALKMFMRSRLSIAAHHATVTPSYGWFDPALQLAQSRDVVDAHDRGSLLRRGDRLRAAQALDAGAGAYGVEAAGMDAGMRRSWPCLGTKAGRALALPRAQSDTLRSQTAASIRCSVAAFPAFFSTQNADEFVNLMPQWPG